MRARARARAARARRLRRRRAPRPRPRGSTLAAPRSSTPTATASSSAGRARRCVDRGAARAARPARSPASASSPTPTCATRSRPRACRSWTASARRSPPPSARRRRSRRRCSTPPSARSTASARRPSPSPATSSTTRSATSSTSRSPCCAAAASTPTAARAATTACRQRRQRRPVLLPPRQRRARPPGLARRGAAPVHRDRPEGARGTRSSATTTCCPGRGPAHAGDRRVRHRRPARAVAGPATAARRATRRRARPPSRRCSAGGSGDTSACPPTRAAGSTPPARPSAGSATRLDYTFDLGPRVRAILLDTVNRDGTSRRAHAAAGRPAARAARAAGDRRVVVFSHNPLDRRRRCAALDAHPQRRRRDLRQPAPNSIEPRGRFWLISTSSLADFPQQSRMFRLARDRRRRRARDLDGRPRRPAAWPAPRASSPTSTPRAAGRSTSRARRGPQRATVRNASITRPLDSVLHSTSGTERRSA